MPLLGQIDMKLPRVSWYELKIAGKEITYDRCIKLVQVLPLLLTLDHYVNLVVFELPSLLHIIHHHFCFVAERAILAK